MDVTALQLGWISLWLGWISLWLGWISLWLGWISLRLAWISLLLPWITFRFVVCLRLALNNPGVFKRTICCEFDYRTNRTKSNAIEFNPIRFSSVSIFWWVNHHAGEIIKSTFMDSYYKCKMASIKLFFCSYSKEPL